MARTKKKQDNAPTVKITWKEIKRQKFLLICAAAFVIYGFIFYYLPLGGWIMAFQNYKPKPGLLGSHSCLTSPILVHATPPGVSVVKLLETEYIGNQGPVSFTTEPIIST